MKTGSISILLLCALCALSTSIATGEEEFDRLDGVGQSGKKVDVIEWGDNLEIHVQPPKSLVGLSLKIDEGRGGSKVMVIGYRFDNSPKVTVIRRAILGIPLKPGFKAYYENDPDYDKIIITNHTLGSSLLAFQLDPPTKDSYPEGHPALRAPASVESEPAKPAKASVIAAPEAVPASDTSEKIQEFSW